MVRTRGEDSGENSGENSGEDAGEDRGAGATTRRRRPARVVRTADGEDRGW